MGVHSASSLKKGFNPSHSAFQYSDNSIQNAFGGCNCFLHLPHPCHPPSQSRKVNARKHRNLLCSRGSLLQREVRGQVRRRGRGRRRQGDLHQGLQRVHQLWQQRGRRQRDGRLLQRVWQVCHHNDLQKKQQWLSLTQRLVEQARWTP